MHRIACLLLLIATTGACSPGPVPSKLAAAREALIAGNPGEARKLSDEVIVLARSLSPDDGDAALFEARVLRTRALFAAGEWFDEGLRALAELFVQHQARVTEETIKELAQDVALLEHATFEDASLEPRSFLADVLAREAEDRPDQKQLYGQLIGEIHQLRPITGERRPPELDIRPVERGALGR